MPTNNEIEGMNDDAREAYEQYIEQQVDESRMEATELHDVVTALMRARDMLDSTALYAYPDTMKAINAAIATLALERRYQL
jgi:hypothetical protein